MMQVMDAVPRCTVGKCQSQQPDPSECTLCEL